MDYLEIHVDEFWMQHFTNFKVLCCYITITSNCFFRPILSDVISAMFHNTLKNTPIAFSCAETWGLNQYKDAILPV